VHPGGVARPVRVPAPTGSAEASPLAGTGPPPSEDTGTAGHPSPPIWRWDGRRSPLHAAVGRGSQLGQGGRKLTPTRGISLIVPGRNKPRREITISTGSELAVSEVASPARCDCRRSHPLESILPTLRPQTSTPESFADAVLELCRGPPVVRWKYWAEDGTPLAGRLRWGFWRWARDPPRAAAGESPCLPQRDREASGLRQERGHHR
jgi:hypothetical protein